MNPPIVGLDLSLTGTGICVAGVCDSIRIRQTGMDRLHSIKEAVLDACTGADLVLVEGYAMGTARQSMTYAIGELGGVVRYSLWDRSIAYLDIPPATLKKFATAKGNANKDAMVATAARLGCPADDNNEVDAWWLYQLGIYVHGEPLIPATGYRDAAIASLVWTGLEVAS